MNARSVFSLLLIIAFLAGCAPQPEPVTPTKEVTPMPETKATPTPKAKATPTSEAKPTKTPIHVAYAIAETVPGGFADYVPYQVKVEPAVPGYEINLIGHVVSEAPSRVKGTLNPRTIQDVKRIVRQARTISAFHARIILSSL